MVQPLLLALAGILGASAIMTLVASGVPATPPSGPADIPPYLGPSFTEFASVTSRGPLPPEAMEKFKYLLDKARPMDAFQSLKHIFRHANPQARMQIANSQDIYDIIEPISEGIPTPAKDAPITDFFRIAAVRRFHPQEVSRIEQMTATGSPQDTVYALKVMIRGEPRAQLSKSNAIYQNAKRAVDSVGIPQIPDTDLVPETVDVWTVAAPTYGATEPRRADLFGAGPQRDDWFGAGPRRDDWFGADDRGPHTFEQATPGGLQQVTVYRGQKGEWPDQLKSPGGVVYRYADNVTATVSVENDPSGKYVQLVKIYHPAVSNFGAYDIVAEEELYGDFDDDDDDDFGFDDDDDDDDDDEGNYGVTTPVWERAAAQAAQAVTAEDTVFGALHELENEMYELA